MQSLSGCVYTPLSSQVPQTVADEEPYLRAETQPRHTLRLMLSCLATACLLSWVLGIWTARVLVTDRDCLRRSSIDCKSLTHSATQSRTYLQLTTSAPIVESGTIGLATARFNGSFLGESIFRLEASPQVDAAWESLGVDCQSPSPRLRGPLSLARNSLPLHEGC